MSTPTDWTHSLRKKTLTGSVSYDPPSLATTVGTSTTITVPGAQIGDFVLGVAFSNSLQGMTITGNVSATDTVTARISNVTLGTLDIAIGILRAVVLPKAALGLV